MHADACDDARPHSGLDGESPGRDGPDVEVTATAESDRERAAGTAVVLEAGALEDTDDPVGVARLRPLARGGAGRRQCEDREQAHLHELRLARRLGP